MTTSVPLPGSRGARAGGFKVPNDTVIDLIHSGRDELRRCRTELAGENAFSSLARGATHLGSALKEVGPPGKGDEGPWTALYEHVLEVKQHENQPSWMVGALAGRMLGDVEAALSLAERPPPERHAHTCIKRGRELIEQGLDAADAATSNYCFEAAGRLLVHAGATIKRELEHAQDHLEELSDLFRDVEAMVGRNTPARETPLFKRVSISTAKLRDLEQLVLPVAKAPVSFTSLSRSSRTVPSTHDAWVQGLDNAAVAVGAHLDKNRAVHRTAQARATQGALASGSMLVDTLPSFAASPEVAALRRWLKPAEYLTIRALRPRFEKPAPRRLETLRKPAKDVEIRRALVLTSEGFKVLDGRTLLDPEAALEALHGIEPAAVRWLAHQAANHAAKSDQLAGPATVVRASMLGLVTKVYSEEIGRFRVSHCAEMVVKNLADFLRVAERGFVTSADAMELVESHEGHFAIPNHIEAKSNSTLHFIVELTRRSNLPHDPAALALLSRVCERQTMTPPTRQFMHGND